MEPDWIGGFFNKNQCPMFECDTCFDYHWINVEVPEDCHINYLELIPVYIGLLIFANLFPDSHIVCYSDNTQVVSMINKGTSANHRAMRLLRHTFWLCVKANVHITARYIPGKENVLADYLSRISHDMILSNFPLSLCCSWISKETGWGTILYYWTGLGHNYTQD